MRGEAVAVQEDREQGLAVRTALPGRLRSLLMDGRDPILLLGAGASITSGIPAAGITVEKVARWAWCKENGRHPDDFTIRRSDYWPWVSGLPWFRANTSLADLYPEAIDNLLGVKSDRRDFFEKLINPNVPPSRGYVAQAVRVAPFRCCQPSSFDRFYLQRRRFAIAQADLMINPGLKRRETGECRLSDRA